MLAVDDRGHSRMFNNSGVTAAAIANDHHPIPLVKTNTNSNNNNIISIDSNNNSIENRNGVVSGRCSPSSNILPLYIEKEIVKTVLFDRKYTPIVWKLRLTLVCRRWFGMVVEEIPQMLSLKAISLHSIREWLDQSQSRFALWPTLDTLSLCTSADGSTTTNTTNNTNNTNNNQIYNNNISSGSSSGNNTIITGSSLKKLYYNNTNNSKKGGVGGVVVGKGFHLEVSLPNDTELKQLYATVKSIKISMYDRALFDRLRIDWRYFSSLNNLSVYSHVSCADLINSLRQPIVLNGSLISSPSTQQQLQQQQQQQIKTLNLQCYGVDLNSLLEIIQERAPNLESLSFQMNENENTIEPFLHQLSTVVSHSLVRLEISTRSYIDFSRLTNSFPRLTHFKFNVRCKPTQQELQHQRSYHLSLVSFVELSPNITELSIQEQTNNHNEWIDLVRRKPLIRKLTLSINNNNSTSNIHIGESIHQQGALPSTLQHLKLHQTNPKYTINFVRLFSHLTSISIYSLGTGCLPELSKYIGETQLLTSFKLNYWVNQHPNKQPIEFQLDPFYSAIQNNQSLRLLVIRDYEFSIQAFNKLSSALEINQTLLFIQVRFFNMTIPKSFELILSKKVKQNLEYLVRTLYRVF